MLGLTFLSLSTGPALLDILSGLRHPAEILRPWQLLVDVPYAVAVILILGAHEMGHYLACRRYGIPATLPFFLPGVPPLGTFGAVIRIRGVIPDRRVLFDIAAAGPLAGFVVALPILAVGVVQSEPFVEDPAAGGFLFGSSLLTTLLEHALAPPLMLEGSPLWRAGWFGMLVTSLNLFPVGQLDGGHAVYAVSPRAHRLVSWACLGAMVSFVAVDSLQRGTMSPYTFWCVILLLLRDRHPRLLGERFPLGAARIAVAVALLVIFVICFVPFPLQLL